MSMRMGGSVGIPPLQREGDVNWVRRGGALRHPRRERPSSAGHVIFVHGLWMSGGESLVLSRRLERHFGFRVHRFRYSTLTATMAEVTGSLQRFVHELCEPRVHFVGHSLGGLVIYRFLERYQHESVGRIVFLGTPCKPSRAALSAGEHSRFISTLLRRSAAEELLRNRERRWTLKSDLGIIAGTRRAGVGQLVAHFDEDCDGTVAVSETWLPGATQRLLLPVSHMGMLLSARVARETGVFLRDGHFSAAEVQWRRV
jgi:pimeloyl-ACP methyl ester carboxylesterase